jgi:hypothetical protein
MIRGKRGVEKELLRKEQGTTLKFGENRIP